MKCIVARVYNIYILDVVPALSCRKYAQSEKPCVKKVHKKCTVAKKKDWYQLDSNPVILAMKSCKFGALITIP